MANTTPMNERNIAFFPMQSVQIGTDELGNPIYDNAADATILQNLRQREIKDGVYPDVSTYLQVMSNSNMTVTVKAGYAHIQGIQVWIKEDVTLIVETAEALTNRVDRVVLRLSQVDRDVTLAVKKGDTTLTRTPGQTWELGLADLAVAMNNAVITQAEITDLRINTTACGVVSGLMQVDTATIFNQYMAWWETQQDTTGYLTVDGQNPSLNTASKLVLGALNELLAYVKTAGSLSTLSTTAKYLVGAINELLAYVKTAGSLSTLSTTAKYLVGAINELFSGKVNITDIVNSISSTETSKPASANATRLAYDLAASASGVANGAAAAATALAASKLNNTMPASPSGDANWIGDQPALCITNTPVAGSWAYVIPFRWSAYYGQIALPYYASAVRGIWTRTFNGTSWSPWDNAARYVGGEMDSTADHVTMTASAVINLQSVQINVKTFNATAWAPVFASAFNVNSSEDYKDILGDYTISEAKEILNIVAKKYTYIQSFNADGGIIHAGVIAEDVAKYFPEAVAVVLDTDEDGISEPIIVGVDYGKMVVPLLVVSINHEDRIAILENENLALKALLVSKGLLTQAEIDSL